jgi:hypothetical protein
MYIIVIFIMARNVAQFGLKSLWTGAAMEVLVLNVITEYKHICVL